MSNFVASGKMFKNSTPIVVKENYNRGILDDIQMIPLSDLDFAEYQRTPSPARIRAIAEKFDIHRMAPIDVSFREGKYWVMNGQHRANAYYLLGFTRIPCIIHRGLTYEQEAYLFAHQSDEVGAINFNHKWNALREAGDVQTTDIIKMCKTWGFTVLERNNKGNNIKCVKTLSDLYKEFGPAKLGTILLCIKNAWDYLPHSADKPIIGGIALLVKTYPQFDFNRLTKVLSGTTPKLILRDMEDKHHAVRGESRRAAYQILDLYNKALNKKFRLDAKVLDSKAA